MSAQRKLKLLVNGLLAVFILHGCSAENETTNGSDTLPGNVVDDEATSPGSEDYLAADMRLQIEQLKQSVADEPTSAETIAARARLLADWIDAYSLAGGEVGLDAPRVRLQSTIPPTGAAAVAQSRNVDSFVREFALRDEEGALGYLSSDNLGPFVVGSMQSLQQTWRVGTRPMATGGGFWVARHFSANTSDLQTDDPAAPGFVSIETTDSDAVFARETEMASGPHGGFRAPEPAIVFRLVAGKLDRGSSVTITYGDQRQGGPGLRMATFESTRMPLPLYVDLDGSREWRSLPITPFVTTGGETTGVHAFGPSIVTPGETFELSVRAEDLYTNRATGAIPAFEVLINDAVVATTPAGNEAITILQLSLPEVGPHWVSVRSVDGSINGVGNPILVEADPEYRIYWGDTHGHSGYSEGIGTVDQYMRFARDDARLDYVTHSEHDSWLDAGEWELIRRTSIEYDAPGKFIPFLGWEWTRDTRSGGHHNVLLRQLGDQTPVSSLQYPVLSSLYAALHERYNPADVVVIPHAHSPGDYRQSDSQLEPLIEVMSMHGSFQWFMQSYLSHGHEVGVVAASDDHMSRPGYSSPTTASLAQRGGLGAVLAPQKSRDAIFDGLKSRLTYATTGDRMILKFDVNGTQMGQRAPYSDSRVISGRVISPAPIRSITLYKNDAQLWQQEYLLDDSAGSEQNLLLSFSSDPTPYYTGDAPRGWRHWRGELQVSGASLTTAIPQDFYNPTTQYFQHTGNVVAFGTHTRGDTSSIRLQLSDVGPDAAITLNLDAARETGSAPPRYREHAAIPATSVELDLAEITGGTMSKNIPQADYPEDKVTLRRVINGGERDISFTVSDAERPDQGDYYYFRVEQADDAIAWSSPIWVGGFPVR